MYHELPTKQLLTIMLKQKKDGETSILLKSMVKSWLQKNRSLELLCNYFSQLYDELYHDIVLKRIRMPKKIRRMLEGLAIPIYKKSEHEQVYALKKIIK